MHKKRVCILGGGISGLSLAWFLSKYSEQLDIVLLEKSERLGGWIRTERVDGFLFERGPHTFRNSRSGQLKNLAIAAGMEKEIIESQKSAKKRYLYLKGILQPIPKWPFLKTLPHEWKTPVVKGDESIYEFACRRFSKEVADLYFDSMAIGVYAGDSKKLSIRSCFPFFKALEERYGSVTKGMLRQLFTRKASGSTLFSFKEGVESLVHKMQGQIRGEIHCNVDVKGIRFVKEGVEVLSQGKVWLADHLFIALPCTSAKALFSPLDSQMGSLFDIETATISVVNLGYKKKVLPMKGFGYLVPTMEKQEILGVKFDSETFPQHNTYPEETRLTVMMKACTEAKDIAQKVLRRHLGITQDPDAVISAEAFIPQCTVGHQERITRLQKTLGEHFPHCTVLGNYLEGVSLNDCVALSEKLVSILFPVQSPR